MQRSSEQPLVGEERYVTTLITAAKETRLFATVNLICSFQSPSMFFNIVLLKNFTCNKAIMKIWVKKYYKTCFNESLISPFFHCLASSGFKNFLYRVLSCSFAEPTEATHQLLLFI